MFRLVVVLFLVTLIASAQPAINPGGVLNAASYTLPGRQGSAIAQGSIFTIFGRNLGPANGVQAGIFPLPVGPVSSLAGTQVRIEFSPLERYYAPVVYTSATQVTAIMPSSVPVTTQGKQAYLVVLYADAESAEEPITIVRSSFGIFTKSANGAGAGAIQNFVPPALLPDNTLYQPAQPSRVAVIWGTGLGPVPVTEDNSQTPPQAVNHPEFGAQVLVGGQPATVQYQGRSSCCSGLDQINIQLPSNVGGCYVPVVVTVGGVVSNSVTMAISPDGATCSDPLGYAADDLAMAQNLGGISVGSIVLERQQSASETTDSGAAWFGRYTLNQVVASRGLSGAPSLGACIVYPSSGAFYKSSDDPVKPSLLDGGQAINLALGGVHRQLLCSGGLCSGQIGGGNLSTFLDAGTFAVDNGVGGTGVHPFNTTLGVSAGITWTNPVTSVPRSQDLIVNWSGGNSAQEYVRIAGYSSTGGVGATFICSAPAGPRTFTVPAAILAALPAGTGKLQVGASSFTTGPYRFTDARMGIDALYLGYNILAVRDVTFAP